MKRKLTIISGLVATLLSPVLQADNADILDFLPSILAAARERPPSPPLEPVEAVTIRPTWTTYVTSSGYLHIVGEVINNTPKHIRYVKIVANIFDSSGQLIDTDFTYTTSDSVAAGKKACFDLLLVEPAGWAKIQFESVQYRDDAAPPVQLALSNVSSTVDPVFGWYETIGQVTNIEGVRVEYVQPIATYYDENGKVLDCDFTFVQSTHLEPGQTSAFRLTASGRDSYDDVTAIKIHVDGNRS